MYHCPPNYLLIAVFLFGTVPFAAGDSPQFGQSDASGLLTIKAGPVQLSVDPKVGGRLASFMYEDKEILRTLRDPNNWQWGSTVWISPQADWNWPPIAAFDQDPFRVIVSDGAQIEIESEIDPTTQLQLTKHVMFRNSTSDRLSALSSSEGGVPVAIMTYTLTNRGDQPRGAALWENTRVHWAGSIEFPADGTIRLLKDALTVQTEPVDDLLRITLNQNQPHGQKLFFTPSTDVKTLSSVYRHNGLAFTKTFPAPSHVAAGQSALEIYLAPDDGFAELEYQGHFKVLEPGKSMSMSVEWKLKRD